MCFLKEHVLFLIAAGVDKNLKKKCLNPFNEKEKITRHQTP
jgi:hypothetical protein